MKFNGRKRRRAQWWVVSYRSPILTFMGKLTHTTYSEMKQIGPVRKIELKYCIDWAWADSFQIDKLEMKMTVHEIKQRNLYG